MLTINYTLDGLKLKDPTKILPDHDCKVYILSNTLCLRETDYTVEGGFNTYRDYKGKLVDDYSVKLKTIFGWCYKEEFLHALHSTVGPDSKVVS